MQFNPSRLVLARKRRGLSRLSLATATTGKISLRSLGYYESGGVEPSNEAVQILADVLQFPAPFFFGLDIEEVACDAASFRSLKAMTASQRDSALAAGSLAVALCNWIEERFELPAPSVPDLRDFDPEIAARSLREAWGLGERPIPNMIHLLEANGVRVFSLPTDSAAVDAFSVWHQETPFVFLSPMKSGERWRMDAGHEIGHLSLHRHGTPRSREAEFEAAAFASAFLMPAGDVLAHTPRSISLEKVLSMKSRWGVAAIALVHRLKALRIVTEWQYRTFCIELSKRGYRREEKDGIGRDASQVFIKVFEGLRAEGLSRGAIARELRISSDELDSLLVGLVLASVPSKQTDSSGKKQTATTRKRPDLRLA
jgi:Zn-dependent peptidase ImmA (M78 family)